jgi:uncharacterized glyoxalase superfamily protein PhnB
MLVGSATIFTVRDLTAALAHYCDVLGFTATFQVSDSDGNVLTFGMSTQKE